MIKDATVLFLVLLGIPALTALFSFWRGGRQIGFFVLVLSVAYTYSVDLNLVSREWYRGSTRGFEISAVDILAAGLLCSLLLRPPRGERRWYWPAGFIPLLLYFFVCLCSALTTNPKLFALFELLKVFRGIVMFLVAALFIRSQRDLRVLIWGVACAVCWEGLLSLKMRYISHVHRIPGSFDHPNSLSMFMVMCAPVLYAAAVSKWSTSLRVVCFAGVQLAVIAVILTISRTGVVTIGLVILCTVATCFTFGHRWKTNVVAMLIICEFGFGVLYARKTLMSRFNEASISEEYSKQNLMNRGSYLVLAGMIRRDHFFGIGLNNWSYLVSNEYGPRMGLPYVRYEGPDKMPDQNVPSGSGLDNAQAPPAHNLAALTLGELGWPGVIFFGALWLRWLQMGSVFLLKRPADPLRRIGLGIFFGLLAVCFQNWTEWEYRQTPMMFMLHLLIGCLAALYKIRHDDIRWNRAERRRERAAFQSQPG